MTLNGYVLGPEPAITAGEVLTLYTINNAIVLGVEKDRGSIEKGKLADLVVLSQDLLGVAKDKIRDTRAMMSLVGGKGVFREGMSGTRSPPIPLTVARTPPRLFGVFSAAKPRAAP